ncbi:MAG: hypothetical protein AVDCRST_MAG77-254, partial [uncultured Chloroflexi bacterium]
GGGYWRGAGRSGPRCSTSMSPARPAARRAAGRICAWPPGRYAVRPGARRGGSGL